MYGLEEQILQALDDGEPHRLLYVWLSNICPQTIYNARMHKYFIYCIIHPFTVCTIDAL